MPVPATRDMKGWIDERAHEIADEEYGKEYYDLTQEEQMIVWSKAEDEWNDKMAAHIDYLLLIHKEDPQHCQCGECRAARTLQRTKAQTGV